MAAVLLILVTPVSGACLGLDRVQRHPKLGLALPRPAAGNRTAWQLAGWRCAAKRSRDHLALLLVGAALLRLALGVLWYTSLPSAGYASPAELRGYVMADAYDRDRGAFELARSEKPLWRAFQGSYHRADQYGGLLFFSAWLYRYAGRRHPPAPAGGRDHLGVLGIERHFLVGILSPRLERACGMDSSLGDRHLPGSCAPG